MTLKLLQTYPYLFANLPVALLLLTVLAIKRRNPLFRMALISGITGVPCTLAVLREQEYWRPPRLGGVPWGLEDAVFFFAAGAAAWLCATWGRRDLTVPEKLWRPMAVWRLLGCGVVTGSLSLCLLVRGADYMSSLLLPLIPLVGLLVILRPRLRRLALVGPAIFVPIYIAMVNLQFALWPRYILCWNRESPWARIVLGIPAGEIAWAVLFSAAWPLAMAFVFDVRRAPVTIPAASVSL